MATILITTSILAIFISFFVLLLNRSYHVSIFALLEGLKGRGI